MTISLQGRVGVLLMLRGPIVAWKIYWFASISTTSP